MPPMRHVRLNVKLTFQPAVTLSQAFFGVALMRQG
jgi:hypothetical protein